MMKNFELIDVNSNSNFKGFLRKLNKVNNKFKSNTSIDISKLEEYKNQFIFIDMCIGQLLLISKIILWFESKNKDFLWPGYFRKAKGMNEVMILTDNLSNTLWIIKSLLSKGADHQAKILFRYLIEQFDILIAILGDEKFHEIYSAELKDEDIFTHSKEKFYKHVRPKKIKKVVENVFNNVLKDKSLGFLMLHFKEKNYEWLSLFSHGDSHAIAIASLVHDGFDDYKSNRYCAIDFKINHTLKELIIHCGLATISIFKLLINHHELLSILNKSLKANVIESTTYFQEVYFDNLLSLLEGDKNDTDLV